MQPVDGWVQTTPLIWRDSTILIVNVFVAAVVVVTYVSALTFGAWEDMAAARISTAPWIILSYAAAVLGPPLLLLWSVRKQEQERRSSDRAPAEVHARLIMGAADTQQRSRRGAEADLGKSLMRTINFCLAVVQIIAGGVVVMVFSWMKTDTHSRRLWSYNAQTAMAVINTAVSTYLVCAAGRALQRSDDELQYQWRPLPTEFDKLPTVVVGKMTYSSTVFTADGKQKLSAYRDGNKMMVNGLPKGNKVGVWVYRIGFPAKIAVIQTTAQDGVVRLG